MEKAIRYNFGFKVIFFTFLVDKTNLIQLNWIILLLVPIISYLLLSKLKSRAAFKVG